MIKKIGILASYNGSGFETIQKAIIEKKLNAKVVVVITNNTNAGVLEKAESYNILLPFVHHFGKLGGLEQ